ncbi:MAG: ABC transporter substrate-binding protein [Corynebacterium sp.]|nr:ABC transporter substrate-binding protein [Corynebacterium sp.]
MSHSTIYLKPLGALLLTPAILLSACTSNDADSTVNSANDTAVSLVNCGKEVTYEATDSWFVNDSNIIALALAAGGGEHIKYTAQLKQDHDLLRAKYGNIVDDLNEVSPNLVSLEEIVAQDPDIFVAGWDYGMSDTNNINPDTLGDYDIDTYILSESCRQEGSTRRGTMDPWAAADEDILNLGKLAGTEDTAEAVVADIAKRRTAIEAAPAPEDVPVGFIFDSGTDAPFTSGSFGAPTAILEAAGSRNAMDSVDDTWVNVSWENLVESDPDYFVFVDYPGQSFEEKIAVLEQNPATKDLPAVVEQRYINLPYAMWCSSPLNIDAAEWIRIALEAYGLVPESDIEPTMSLPSSLDGLEYLPNEGQLN